MVERTLLAGAAPDLLHVLHIVRGTGTSFLLAGLVAWYVLRRRPAPAEPSPAPGGLRTIVAEAEAHELAAQAVWIIRLRWIAIAGVVVTTVFCRHVLGAISGLSALALLLITGCMAGYNILFRLIGPRERAAFPTAFAQVFLDLAALTLMIYFAGGPWNPFLLFYLFHIVIAGILLGRGETYLVTLVSCALFCGMALGQEAGLLRAYPLLLGGEAWPGIPAPRRWPYVGGILSAFVLTSWCTAYFATTIMQKLRRRGAQVLEAGEILSQERAKTQDIVRNVGAGLMILDLEHRVLWVNDIAREWFGPDVVGAFCPRGPWGQEAACDGCPAPGAPAGGSGATHERSRFVGAKMRFFLVKCSPIRGADGRVDQILELVQDITPVKEMEIQIVQTGKMAAVGQLAAGIAHEISNPLAIVASSAELLRETVPADDDSERFARHLRRIEENVYRCKEIIQNLLAFARREDEGPEPTDLSEVLDDTLRLVEGGARARDRRIERALPKPAGDALALPLCTRPRLVQQVVLNLVLNALDAAPAGGRVTVAAEAKDGGAEIAVSDTGPGIAPEHLGRLFEPFFTTKPAGKGTGLGLYLCHQFVESLGGRISVSSRPGEGATFTVWLPNAGATKGGPGG